MKHSKTLLFAVVTVALCFAIGFGIGAFPDRWQKFLGRHSSELTILASSPKILPAEFLFDFEKATGIPVQIKVIESYHLFRSEAQNADLLFAPLSWLGNFPEIFKPLPEPEKFNHLLSTDFQNLNLKVSNFLPLLWKTQVRNDENHLLIWGLATTKTQISGLSELISFLMTSDRRLKDWARQSPDYNFTLESSNQISDFPEEQRARKIRDVRLPNLVIDQKFSADY